MTESTHDESDSAPSTQPAKLLTEAQKRQNHLEAEKKRRANIQTALKDLAESCRCDVYASEETAVKSGGKRKRSEGTSNTPKESAEAIVLSKAVEYIRKLEEERVELQNELAELEKGQAT